MPVVRGEKRTTSPLGKHLREKREAMHLLQYQVAGAVGMDPQVLRRLEQGAFMRISPEVLLKLAAFLQTTPNELLGVEP